MADTLLLRQLKAKPKVLNLNNKHLRKVPRIIGKFFGLLQLQLKTNDISVLPNEFGELVQLEVLNLGNNKFEELPFVLRECIALQKLNVFGNRLVTLNPTVLVSMKNLTFLNCNGNQISSLPPEICRLSNLQSLVLNDNCLEELPYEICALTCLEDFQCNNNSLLALPLEFGYLINLKQLLLNRNHLKELPESIGKCYKLETLDIAGNEMRILPTQFAALPLKEFYHECNPLLEHKPEEEILSLKEVCARYVMKELKDRFSVVRRDIRYFPQVRDLLSQASRCAVCNESFLNTWLECVTFLDVHKAMTTKNLTGLIPIRALLCSYRCFNKPGHNYYGVAFP